MDRFIEGHKGADVRNFAIATEDSASIYHKLAPKGAIIDRYFISSAGASAQNNMYYAAARFFFLDNYRVPQGHHIRGTQCYNKNFTSYQENTIADLLNKCQVKWTYYAGGYDKPGKNRYQCYPHFYDASDNPFTYFPSITDSPTSKYNFRDLNRLYEDIRNKTLPSISYVKFLGINSEHPGPDLAGSLTSGQAMAKDIIDMIEQSPYYSKNTVVIMVPDEAGGYYDHVAPPKAKHLLKGA
jgi:phospholipase C